MSLKKFLKTNQVRVETRGQSLGRKRFLIGQSSLEYLLLLLAIAGLTLLSVTAVFPKVKGAGRGLFTQAVERIR